MRKVRFACVALALGFVTATFAIPAMGDPIPTGTCTPPGAWSTRSDFPSTVVRAWGQFFPASGKFYVLGGRFDNALGDDLLQPSEYDPTLDSWTTKTSTFEDGQVNNMVGGVLDFDGTPYVVLVGGSASMATTATADVRQYDPVNDTLTVLTDDPWPGNAGNSTKLPGGAAVVDNKLYVFGGFDIGTSMLDQIYRFDPAAAPGSRWTLMTSTLPSPLGYIPTAASGGLIYLLGGTIFVDAATLDDSTDVSVYDPVADTLTSASAIPRATGETRAVTQTDGTIWVLGGGRTDPNPSNEVDVYTPSTDSWAVAPALANARRNFPADVDPATGNVWATGGYDIDGVTPLAVNEQFTPCATVDDIIFTDGFDGPV